MVLIFKSPSTGVKIGLNLLKCFYEIWRKRDEWILRERSFVSISPFFAVFRKHIWPNKSFTKRK